MPKRENLDGVENAVLQLLRQSDAPQPAHTIAEELTRRGFEAHTIRMAIQYLLDQREIELTRDSHLRAAA